MTDAAVRKRLWGGEPVTGRDVGEAVRDLQLAKDAQVRLRLARFEALYTEPMYVTFETAPLMLLAQVHNARDPMTLTGSGSACEFHWDGSRCVVRSIDGMTPGSETYTFVFLAVG